MKVLCVICVLLFLTGCNNLKTNYDIKKPIIAVDNTADYKDSKNEKVDILKFAEKSYNGLISDTYDVRLLIGLDHLRRFDHEGYSVNYSVHRVKQGGLLYVFYVSYENGATLKKENWFYSKKKISKKDFAEIETGSTKREVLKIDPATQVYLNRYESDPIFKDNISLIESYHYLTDGCMRIYWKYAENDLVVENIEFFEDYNVRRYTSVKEYYNCKVLDKDTLWYDPEKAETESE